MVAPGKDITVFDRKMIEDGNYWIEKLSRETGVSNLRLDFQRPALYSQQKDQIEVEISGLAYQKLTKLTGNGSFLIYTTLMAALKACLLKYTGNTTIVVGSPLRRHDDSPDAINALAIVDEIDDRISFQQLLMNVRQTLLEAYERQRYPFNRLVKDLKLEVADNRCPLFDVALELEDIHGKLPDLRNDITITWTREAEKLSGRFQFNAGLFRKETIRRLAVHLINLLSAALDNKEARLKDLDMLAEAERRQLVVEWNDTASAYPSDMCFHQLFEAQAGRSPEAVACVMKEERLTYAQLNARANRLARRLSSMGVEPDTRVAICVERSIEMVVGILGILKAGAAYVPLDPSYPADRLAFMLEDAQACVLVTQSSLRDIFAQSPLRAISLDDERESLSKEAAHNLTSKASPQSLAYVIYTSGSTGNPKGVMINHKGLVNYLSWCSKAYRVDEGDGAPAHSPFGFDLTITSLFSPLVVGKSITLVDESEGIDGLTAALLSGGDFSLVKITPAHLEVIKQGMLPEQAAGRTRALVIGGEALAWEHLSFWRKYAPETRIINEYGPTETVVGCCIFEVKGDGEQAGEVPIGRPIANAQIYLLDRSHHLVPVGVPGEICIGGDGLARGYLNRPDLTAERFIPNPFGSQAGSLMYKTGDLGVYLPDGNIAFLGRADNQVKIRGYRIELGEIETCLMQHPAVREAAVLAKEYAAGDKRLVAFFDTVEGEAISVIEMRSFLAQRLPEYMVPSSFVPLESLPLNSNGKVDRKALASLDTSRAERGHDGMGPRTPIEELLMRIWSQVLGTDEVSADENFFDLGGHSLLATQVISRVKKAFNIELPLRRLFESPTLAGLASCIESAMKMGENLDSPPVEPVPRDGLLPLSFAQQRLWFLDQLASDKSVYNGPIAIRLAGPLNEEALRKTLDEIVNRHEVLRTTFVAAGGRPAQVITPPQAVRLPAVDLTAMAEAERETRALEMLKAESRKPFDLANELPWRVKLFRMGEQDHIVLFVMHHIISDAWATGILVREVATLYRSLSRGEQPDLPALPIQYADYAVWQRNWLKPDVIDTLLRYWTNQLKQAPALLNLPTDRPRPSTQSYHGATRFFSLGAELTGKLVSLSRQRGATMFMTLLAGFQALLHRHSGQDHIAVGSPIANRNRAETEGLIGCLVNTLVLNTDLSGNPTFDELLVRVREVCLGAYAHQDLPFEMLVEAMQPKRKSNYTPMFQVWFVLQNAPVERLQLDELTLSGVEMGTDGAQFDLVMSLVETGDAIQGAMTYNTDLFEEASVDEMLEQYRRMLEAAASGEEMGILDVVLEEGDGEPGEGRRHGGAFDDEFEDQFVISASGPNPAD